MGDRETLFINGRFLTQPVTGVQRYARELLRGMDALLAQGDFPRIVCLTPRTAFAPPGWERIEICRVGINKGNLWEQIDLPFYARGGLLFSPTNSGPAFFRNQVVTLHDASVFATPGAYSSAFRAKYVFMFNQFARRARRLLTVSDFSRRELAGYLKIPPERVVAIPSGCDHMQRIRPDAGILARHRLEKDAYLLIVASRSAHKNLKAIFAALGVVGARIKVALAGGSAGWVFRGEAAPSPPANVEILGYVRDEELKALYENALGLVFPSIYEGFGLPVLEAMRCGCPVLSSDAAALPETAGEAALYFDPRNPARFAGQLRIFLADSALRDDLRRKGYQRAARFTWEDTARRALEILVESRSASHRTASEKPV